LDASGVHEKGGPGAPDVGCEPHLVPQVEEVVDADEPAYVIVGALAEHDLVYL
jgi:hypothetical protein